MEGKDRCQLLDGVANKGNNKITEWKKNIQWTNVENLENL
jgi:hypothetical protein